MNLPLSSRLVNCVHFSSIALYRFSRSVQYVLHSMRKWDSCPMPLGQCVHVLFSTGVGGCYITGVGGVITGVGVLYNGGRGCYITSLLNCKG